jgi:hypothetical protein
MTQLGSSRIRWMLFATSITPALLQRWSASQYLTSQGDIHPFASLPVEKPFA